MTSKTNTKGTYNYEGALPATDTAESALTLNL